jgi:hypothetical protein
VRHPGLRSLVGGSPVATKLTARLNSDQMKADAYVAWSPFKEKRLRFYSEHGAGILATNLTVPVVVVALLILFFTRGAEGARAQKLRKGAAIAAFAAVLLWPMIYLFLPKIPVVVHKRPAFGMMALHGDIARRLEVRAGEQTRSFPPDLAWVRSQLAETSSFRRDALQYAQTNYFTDLPWREEDSPGNWTARQTADGIEYVWYDLEGGEHAIPLFREEPFKRTH